MPNFHPSLSALFICAAVSNLQAAAQSDSVRIAYYGHGKGISRDFLVRAKAAGYNYVLGEFSLARGLDSLEANLTSAFETVDMEGLRLIPLIQSGGKWSAHWRKLDPGIQMNALKNGRACPSWSPRDERMENAFRNLASSLRKAFAAARLPYGLEYVHLGHDEAAEAKKFGLLIGYGETEFSRFDREDVQALLASGDDPQTAFQKIMAGEIYRRVKTLADSLGGRAKVLIHGDMWDPQANGGNPQNTFLESGGERVKIRTAPNGRASGGIASLPGLDATQKAFLKKHLIVMPWIYARVWKPSPDGGREYKPEITFAYLTGNGLGVVYEGALATANQPVNKGAAKAIEKYALAARQAPHGILGYASMHWGVYAYDPSFTCWKTLEYMAQQSRR